MLRQLRQRAREVLSETRQIVLSTSGPAEIQASALSCEAIGLCLYALLPRTSDLLFNLESNPLVVVTADAWQARGSARPLPPDEYPDRLAIGQRPEAAWCELIEIRPARLYLGAGLSPAWRSSLSSSACSEGVPPALETIDL